MLLTLNVLCGNLTIKLNNINPQSVIICGDIKGKVNVNKQSCGLESVLINFGRHLWVKPPKAYNMYYSRAPISMLSHYSARNKLAIAHFQPISTFGQPKSILVGQIYCTFSMGQQLITYKSVLSSKNG